MSTWETITGGVCAPRGFRANAVSCGIKNPANPRLDLALIVSDHPCVVAGTFTKNQVCAAPVQLCRENLAADPAPRAILANSGNANACTGTQGLADARAMAQAAAAALNLAENQVFIASTGIIGMNLPMERILARIPAAAQGLHEGNSDDAAAAIMTSDTKPKQIALRFTLSDGTEVRIGGIAKGAGMIRPNMATMLAFFTTDAAISKDELAVATRHAVDRSFNRITVDGDMSTNDTVLVLANAQAGHAPLQPGSPEATLFRDALTAAMLDLAKHIVGDGERVTRFVTVKVRGAHSDADAKLVAEAVANSNLVKCSWNGGDPNWGRVIHAVGYAGAPLDPNKIDVFFDDLIAAKSGMVAETPVPDLAKVAAQNAFTITIDLNLGEGVHEVYSSDLSPEYVVFNREEYSALKVPKPQS